MTELTKNDGSVTRDVSVSEEVLNETHSGSTVLLDPSYTTWNLEYYYQDESL